MAKHFKGQIKRVVHYDYALSAKEIQELYKKEVRYHGKLERK